MAAIILHDNGRMRALVDRKRLTPNLGPVYCRVLEKQILENAGLHSSAGKPNDLDVVLCTTKPEKQYTERILDALGIDTYVVLGRHLSEWRHIFKIQLILEHIINNPRPELLLHLDAPDVLLAGDLQSAVDSFFDGPSCDLLFGAEKGSAPGSSTTKAINTVERRFIERIEDFERGAYDPPFCHLNAGCFIGRKQAIREFFSEVLEARDSWPLTSRLRNGNLLAEDDQLLLRELHRIHHPNVQIDHHSTIFQNLFAVRRSELAIDQKIPHGPAFLVEALRHLVFLVKTRAFRRLGMGG